MRPTSQDIVHIPIVVPRIISTNGEITFDKDGIFVFNANFDWTPQNIHDWFFDEFRSVFNQEYMMFH